MKKYLESNEKQHTKIWELGLRERFIDFKYIIKTAYIYISYKNKPVL